MPCRAVPCLGRPVPCRAVPRPAGHLSEYAGSETSVFKTTPQTNHFAAFFLVPRHFYRGGRHASVWRMRDDYIVQVSAKPIVRLPAQANVCERSARLRVPVLPELPAGAARGFLRASMLAVRARAPDARYQSGTGPERGCYRFGDSGGFPRVRGKNRAC